MVVGKHQITIAEQNRRRGIVVSATASLELEGADFSNTPDNVHYDAWVNGDLTYEELKVKLKEVRHAKN